VDKVAWKTTRIIREVEEIRNMKQRPPIKLLERLPKLRLLVHDDRPVPRDRLSKRLS